MINAVADQDHAALERWAGMADADTSVVVDAHLGGYPVVRHRHRIAGHPPQRRVPPPTARTSSPPARCSRKSSKKTARAINAASGSRPLVVLANLSGFDGSPESLRNIQLEYGAEIGRAIVNFDGPIMFCVVSRYHGGAFVVFSGALNENMEVIAVEGSFASVIGGAPAAAVVFTRDVNTRTASRPHHPTTRNRNSPPPPTTPPKPTCGSNSPPPAPPSAPRNSAKSPPNSKPSTTSNAPAKWDRSTTSSPPTNSAPESSPPSNTESPEP